MNFAVSVSRRLWIAILVGIANAASAAVQPIPIPPSLKTVEVPIPPGVLDGPEPIVVDREKAVVLGKALFWDMAIGSDGIACASCHFHAGADSRTKNQFSPGKAHMPSLPEDAGINKFAVNDSRGSALANYQLRKGDFPLFKFGDPTQDGDSNTLLSPNSHNTVSSSGTFSGQFAGIAPDGTEQCTPFSAEVDASFAAGGLHTRRVEPRNTPTIINAVLFDRTFWDGRANPYFNGVSPWGPRDPDAYVWVTEAGTVWKSRLALPYASIASLATAPVVNEFEMSCQGRSFKDVARKLLSRRPLADQEVHAEDGVLGGYRDTGGKGLALSYRQLVEQAFASRYWSAGRLPAFGKPSYSSQGFSQEEANFSLFFGLAIQLYASTLISDDSPFDNAVLSLTDASGRVLANFPTLSLQTQVSDGSLNPATGQPYLGPDELEGMKLFFNGNTCPVCHSGPLFSTATSRVLVTKAREAVRDGSHIDLNASNVSFRNMVERRKKFSEAKPLLIDTGYFNNASVPAAHDPGLNGTDPFGNPLAYAPQYLDGLAGKAGTIYEPLPRTIACKFEFPFTSDDFKDTLALLPVGVTPSLVGDPAGTAACPANFLANAKVPNAEFVAFELGLPAPPAGTVDPHFHVPQGSFFKVPQLYNVELTGPYMHDGGMASLEQAVDNYLRSGNFSVFNNDPALRNAEYSTSVFAPPFTDPGPTYGSEQRRQLVAFLKALTDPRVRYERAPFDHPQLFVPQGHPDTPTPNPGSPGQAADVLMEIPAVGMRGRETPLPSFQDLLPD